MKKIIGGKLYNTETATKICHWSGPAYKGDFKYCEFDLFLSKKGKFFIVGEGGAASRFAVKSGNTSCGGRGLQLVFYGEALGYAESKWSDATTETIEKYFEIEEG